MLLNEPYRRYLRLLGIEGTPSGIDGLREVVRRHLCRVPFENVSKLLLFAREGAGRFFTLTEFLDGIEHQDLGGTCHSCNPFLAELLRALAYDVDLLGADMSQPNVHTCLRVRVDGAAYHVDAGYGGPFREPMPLDRLPCEIVEGEDRYVLDRQPGGYAMSVFTGSERVHAYAVNEEPRQHDFFTPAMLGSFKPTATFMTNLRICRIFDDYSATVFNRSMRIHRGTGVVAKELSSDAEFASAIANELQMPRCPWKEVLTDSANGIRRPR